MRLFIITSVMLLLAGCSSLDRIGRTPTPTRVVKPVPPRIIKPMPLPAIPEIKAPVVVKPYRYKKARVVKPRLIKPRKPRYKARKKSTYKAPRIGRYPSSASPRVSTTPVGVKNRHSVAKPMIAVAPIPNDDELDIDPYANIPENAGDKGTGRSISSPAVKTLLVRAYADAKLGRTDAAMSKLERGLRIEPQNPALWNQLAELHYKKGNYQQAIAMAKKAINYSSSNEEITTKNWNLISRVAKKSGDSRAMAEVNAYNKQQ
ncbi:MAG: tetratricopeptide repeat protein [Cocleimonas sp.]|nr:tetratricopeptide repeat protein [Cocleimonas sp.]